MSITRSDNDWPRCSPKWKPAGPFRAVRLYNATPPNGVRLLEYSVASKITCTQYAFEIANEAIQLFGGNGMCREYLPEKLFRDARATLIEDGNNEILAMAAGRLLGEHYPRQNKKKAIGNGREAKRKGQGVEKDFTIFLFLQPIALCPRSSLKYFLGEVFYE